MSDESTGSELITDLKDGVLHLRLNRPDRLNALNSALRDQLRDGGDRAHLSDVRCILISAEGRGFCSGADLGESKFAEWTSRSDLRESYIPMMNALAAAQKPIVTAVQGVATGAGLSLALCGDVVLASPEAKFLPLFTSIGIVPDAGLSHFLLRRMTYARAYQWLLENEAIVGEGAVAAGIANQLLPSEGFLDAAYAYAVRIAEVPGIGASSTKQVLVEATRNSLPEQLELEARLQLWATRDENAAAYRHNRFRSVLGKQ